MKLGKTISDFINSERSGGIILVVCALVSLILANTVSAYVSFWHFEFAGHHLTHWINDGLMTIFFLLVGLELKREIIEGELSTLKKASLPAMAALGGMIIPATIYFSFNVADGNVNGVGIPMATDIAFALGVLSLLRSSVPTSLKIFLTALAVIDDLGAIIVIALFYTDSISWINLGIASAIFTVLLLLNRFRVYNVIPYLLAGIAMWYFMLHSGVHATLTGVLIAFVIPFERGNKQASSNALQHFLHRPVAFIILPVFALANTAITLDGDYSFLSSTISMGIMAGLILGKPFGITLFSYAAVKMKISELPASSKWTHILGIGLLGGIGFTMSIFISILAFDDMVTIDQSKISVLVASFISAVAGFIWLKRKP